MNTPLYFRESESAARVLSARRWETSECGHGTCAAEVDCTDACKLKSAVLNLPVIDVPFLDSQINGLPIEMIEPIPSVVLWAEYLKTAGLVIVAGLVLAATLYASTK